MERVSIGARRGFQGRPFPIHTPLGREMWEQGISVADIFAFAGVHHRTMTEYLANRIRIRPHHLVRLAEYLKVDPEALTPPPDCLVIAPRKINWRAKDEMNDA